MTDDDDEEGWAAAIEEWDSALDLPFDESDAGAQPAQAAPAQPAEGQVDPLVHFIEGEMEIPEGEGQALGSLLGSTEGAAPEPAPSVAEPAAPGSHDIGISPDQVTATDAEVSISTRGWEPAEIEIEDRSIQEEPTPVRTAVAEEEPTPSGIAAPDGERPSAPALVPLDVDLDGLMDGLVDGAEPEPPAAPKKAPAAAAEAEVAPPPRRPHRVSSEHPPLEVFDELVPPVEEGFDKIEAGDVLPRAEEPAVAEPGAPTTIPDELEELVVEEPALEPPQIPEHLRTLDVATLEIPERIEPVAPLAAYLDQITGLLAFETGLTDSSTRAAAMELLAARTLETNGSTDEALERYQEVLGHQPGHVPALRALRRLFTERGEADRVAEILGQMAPRVGDAERQALLISRADLLWSKTGDDDGARAILDEHGSGELRDLLIRADLAAAAGDNEALASVLASIEERVADATHSSALAVEQGRQLEMLGRPEEARAAYRRAEGDPGATEGLLRVCGQLDDPAGQAAALIVSASEPGLWSARRLRRAARLATHRGIKGVDPLSLLNRAAEMAGEDSLVLEDQTEALRRGDDAAAALEAFTALASVVPESTHRALALLDAGLIAEERMGDVPRALDLYSRAGDALPGSIVVQAMATQLELVTDDPERRLQAHRALAGASQGEHRSAHHLRAALLLERELQREEDAAAQLLEALEHDPANSVARVALEAIYRRTDRLDRLAATLDNCAEATENATESVDLRLQSGLLHEGPLADPGAAATRYRQALEQDSARDAARLGLHRMLARQQRLDELIDAIHEEAVACEQPARAAYLWTTHGDLLATTGREVEAEESYRMALDKMPGMPQATLALTLLYGRGGRWADVAEQWNTALEGLPPESPQRKAFLMRLGALQECGLEDPAAAAACYEAAAADPPAPGALEGLTRSLRAAGQTDRLARELERELGQTTDAATRLAVLITVGELALQSGIDWSEAESRFRRALTAVPGHPVPRRSLEELYRSQTAWQALADLQMEDLGDADISARDRIRIYERLVSVDQQRGDSDNARLSCESILEVDPGNVRALRALQHAHLMAERYQELARVLRLEAQDAPAGTEAAALWCELGRLLVEHPASPETEGEAEASVDERAAYLKAAELEPTSTLALRRLVDAAMLAGNREDVAKLYTRLAATVGTGREAAVYLARAGELLADARLFGEALDQVPDYLGAIYRLRDLALRMGNWEVAYRASDAECRASAHHEHRLNAGLLAGEIASSRLADPERAASAYKQALADSPTNQFAFRHLRLFLEENGRWSELAELLTARTRVERSRARLIDLHRAIAHIDRDHLQDGEGAKRQLQQLLEIEAENREALQDLTDLYVADGQWGEAANTLIQLARLDKEPERLKELFLRLGRIYHDNAPDAKRAVMSLSKVLALDPDNPEALDRLSRLYMQELDFQKALTMATELLEQTSDKEKRVEVLLRTAKIHEDGLKDAHQAAIAYRRALEVNPVDLGAIGEVIGFFVRQGDQRSLMIHLDRSVATMRGLLRHNALDPFAYQALFKIFGWRKAPDGCFCAAQILDALGQSGPEERRFLDSHVAAVGAPGMALGDPEFDELVFDRSIPGGFLQVFRLLADAFVKYFPGDPKEHGASKSDRIADVDHPLRRIGDSLARDFGVHGYDLYLLKSKPTALIVENTSPPAILVGKALLHEATEAELQFMMGRSLWMISRSMVLPAFLRREELELLMAGIVRQYQPDFQPADVDPKGLHDATKKVGRAIPRKLKQELMPFALECSGTSVDLRSLGASVVHSANRAGLLTCRSVFGALSVLCRTSGLMGLPPGTGDRAAALKDNQEGHELLRFGVSDAYFELRRGMHIAVQ